MSARQHNWLLFAACLCTGATAMWLRLGIWPFALLAGTAATMLVAFGLLYNIDGLIRGKGK